MVIRKIFGGNFDEEVHSDFLKFGRGEFKDRYLIRGKRQIGKWVIKTSAEFANFFVKRCLEKVSGEVEIKGVIIATFDLRKEIDFDFKKVSSFQGIRKHQIDGIVEPKQIIDLMEKYPRAFFGLSFKGNCFELKIKAKAPKSGKPGKKNSDGLKVDFCSLKTSDGELLSELFFDVGLNWKEIKIDHAIRVEDIIYPENVSAMKPEEIRENSKRGGKVKREVWIDGQHIEKEANFEA